MKLERVDLVLAGGAGLDGAGGADLVAWAGQGVWAQALADVDCGQARESDALRIADHEVGVAVAVGIDPLDVDDVTNGFAAGGVTGSAVRKRGRSGSEN